MHKKGSLGLGLRGSVTECVTGSGWQLQSLKDRSHELEKKADT